MAPPVPLPKPAKISITRDNFPKVERVGLDVPLFSDLHHRMLTLSWGRYILLVFALFLGLNALFAGLYLLQPGCIEHANSVRDVFFFSVQTFATIGYGGMAPTTLYSHAVVTVEALSGMLAISALTGFFFARLTRPSARVIFSDKVVIAPRDGVPHVMFRMGNGRRNQILEAQLRVILLVHQRTREGHAMRVPVDITLVRDRSAVFGLTWTALHKVDATSPFYGPDALDRLRSEGAEMFLSVTGVDETTGQTLHARRAYSLDDVIDNALFVDVLRTREDGTRVLDYSTFHEVTPLPEEHRFVYRSPGKQSEPQPDDEATAGAAARAGAA